MLNVRFPPPLASANVARSRVRRWAVAGAATTGLAISLTIAAPSQAHDTGSNQCRSTTTPIACTSWANNRWHAIRYNGVIGNQIPGLDDAVISVLNNVYDPTDLVAYRDESDPLPDVWVHENDYLAHGIVAWVNCKADNTGTGGTHPNRWCRGQHAYFNGTYEQFYRTSFERRRLVCHEFGHTLGLRHRDTPIVKEPEFTIWGCMHPGVAFRDGVSADIDSHHRDHINDRY